MVSKSPWQPPIGWSQRRESGHRSGEKVLYKHMVWLFPAANTGHFFILGSNFTNRILLITKWLQIKLVSKSRYVAYWIKSIRPIYDVHSIWNISNILLRIAVIISDMRRKMSSRHYVYQYYNFLHNILDNREFAKKTTWVSVNHVLLRAVNFVTVVNKLRYRVLPPNTYTLMLIFDTRFTVCVDRKQTSNFQIGSSIWNLYKWTEMIYHTFWLRSDVSI